LVHVSNELKWLTSSSGVMVIGGNDGSRMLREVEVWMV
jgi:hypothetical protein